MGLRQPRRPAFTIAIPALLAEIPRLLHDTPATWTSDEFPFVLSAGERRAFTANTIIRNPGWRDAEGALRLSPTDAEALGIVATDRVRVTTENGSAETQSRDHRHDAARATSHCPTD